MYTPPTDPRIVKFTEFNSRSTASRIVSEAAAARPTAHPGPNAKGLARRAQQRRWAPHRVKRRRARRRNAFARPGDQPLTGSAASAGVNVSLKGISSVTLRALRALGHRVRPDRHVALARRFHVVAQTDLEVRRAPEERIRKSLQLSRQGFVPGGDAFRPGKKLAAMASSP